MKKVVKRILIGVGVFFGIIVIAVSGLLIYVFTDADYGFTKKQETNAFLTSWQDSISDATKLNELVMPGSHDAGSNGMMPLAQTQGHDIIDQLNGGVRYFDLRVKFQGDTLVIFHDIITGQKFENVLSDISEFTAAHPSELLVLDFQHLGDTAHEATIQALKDGLDLSKAMKKSALPTIENATMADVRDLGYNYVIVWTNTTEAESEDFLYPRTTSLKSPYDGNEHKKSPQELITHFQTYYDGYNGEGFFVLQAQRTAPFILVKPSALEYEFKPHINEYIAALATSPNLSKTNIIMRDFVSHDINNVRYILKLNITKNLVKSECIENFTIETTID